MSVVSVYWTTPDEADATHVEAALALLDADERERHRRFRFARDQKSFALSHALVRAALSAHGEPAAHEWRFVLGEWGRPILTNPDGPHFSLSHTAGAIAVAVSALNIGVDVERIVTRAGTLELADHYFSPLEAADVDARKGADRADRFFHYWTLKESYIKARSMGLMIPLDGFGFVGSDATPRIEFNSDLVDDLASRWQFRTAWVADRVPLALCAEAASPPLVSIEHVAPEWFCPKLSISGRSC